MTMKLKNFVYLFEKYRINFKFKEKKNQNFLEKRKPMRKVQKDIE